MKTKWYFFFLTIMTVSAILYAVMGVPEEETVEIGVLMIGENRNEKFEGLKRGLNDLGYEDKDVHYIVKNAKDDERLLDQHIESLLSTKLDLIVTLGAIETLHLKEQMERVNLRIPVVFAGLAAPKELGLIEDYRAPGGLFTGINNYFSSISGKRLELLTSLVPDIQIVHVIYDSKIDVSRMSLAETKEAAKKLGIRVTPCDASQKGCMERLWKDAGRTDALLVLPSFRIESLTNEIVKLTVEKQIPAMGLYEVESEKGLLASYGASFYSQGYQASRFVSLILQGNEPGDLPVELPDGIKFVINKETMDALKLNYNPDLFYISEFIHPEDQQGGKKK